MAKSSKRWVCNSCGSISHGWFGRCPNCSTWNSIVEQSDGRQPIDRVLLSSHLESKVVPADEASHLSETQERLKIGIREIDRVLGGGLVPGSVILLGGTPGIGKSTLLLQACCQLAGLHGSVLYASGEESVAQVGSRLARLTKQSSSLLLMAETRLEIILKAVAEHKPCAIVIDSIQTIYSSEQEGLPGNVTQIRSVSAQLLSLAKSKNIPTIIVGHVTKDGQLAGPRLLEHMVDAVLSFEGDEDRATRLLRATKNRFGNTQELGVFEMTSYGLSPIENPSEAFLSEYSDRAVGSCVTATLEGTRPLLIEVQALSSHSPGGSPRRTCVGADPLRLAMLLAVLDRHAGLFVGDHDVFINIAGGLRVHEPAADLSMILAISSSYRNLPLVDGLVAIGEVGLTGELRRVPRIEERLKEAHRLGFKRAIIPKTKDLALPKLPKFDVVPAEHIRTAIDVALDESKPTDEPGPTKAS